MRHLPLAAILAVAAVARLSGINFGLPHLNSRPDEGAIASIVGGMYEGQLNPGVFNYPALFMLCVTAALLLLTTTGAIATVTSTTTYRIARYLSASAGIASVLMMFFIGRRLFDRTTALAAAALLSLAFLHVRDSHFGVTDVPMTFLALVAFLFIVRLSESGNTRDLIAAGVAAGLATSTKYNAALIALPAMFVVFAASSGAVRPWRARLRDAALYFALMGGAFLMASPYTLLDYSRFLEDFGYESRHLTEGHVVDLGRGWRHHLVSTLRFGVGVPILAAGIGGFLLLLWRDRRKGLMLALFPVTYYLVLGSGRTVFARYMLPVVPFLCLAAGYAVTEAARWVAARADRPRLAPMLVAAGVAGLLWPSAHSAIAFDRLISLEDNRLLARRWVERHFPRETTIAQLGTEGGHVFLHDSNEVRYVRVSMSRRRDRPDLVIVQSSPLPTAPRQPARIAQTLAEGYDAGFHRNGVGHDPANVYDWQDQFFLPIAGFRGIERPGPNLTIYIRRGTFPKVPRLREGSVGVR